MSTFSVINILARVIVILGCLLFVFSIVYPFYHVISGSPGAMSISQLWSFKSDSQTWGGIMYVGKEPFRSQSWFFDYWLNPPSLSDVGISWILPLLFIIQVLTLAFGVVFVIFNRRIFSYAPEFLSLAVILLVIYTNLVVTSRSNVGPHWLVILGEYQLGYYFVYPSIAMFILAVALNEIIKRRQTATSSK